MMASLMRQSGDVVSEDQDDSESGSDLSDTEDGVVIDTDFSLSEMLTAEHHGCFSHTLQLVVKDGLKESNRVTNIISKCSKIVALVRRSTVLTEILEGENRLQTATETRWNSQLKIVRSFLKISSEILDKADLQIKLTTFERSMLEELISILIPF